MVGMGSGRYYMYHYFDDKEILKLIQRECSKLVKELENELREREINSQVFLVGSGGRNMVTQNEGGPIDFDYNLNILSCNDINDCRYIKETVRKAFNNIMRDNGLQDVEDSTSSLTTKEYFLKSYPEVEFSIDLCIVAKDNKGNWCRLIHQKTGDVKGDGYFWNIAPNSKTYKEKAVKIKSVSCWEDVREEYIKIKNRYLRRNDNNHPSFVCYVEAVNNVYNKLKQDGAI